MTTTHNALLAQVRKALEIWKALEKQNKELTNNKYNASTISKMKKDDNPPSEETVSGFLEHINTELRKNHYEYDYDTKKYVRIPNENGEMYPIMHNHEGIFKSIAGHYEMFFLASTQNSILKNIFILHADGNVKIEGQGGHTHYGEAKAFGNSLLAINMYSLNRSKEFHYQILLHIGNYLDVFGEKVERLFGMATTITSQNLPSATLRVLIRLKNTVQSQPCEYRENTPEYTELHTLYPNLVPYITQNNAHIHPQRQANDMI